jgi:hypothetical protein
MPVKPRLYVGGGVVAGGVVTGVIVAGGVVAAVRSFAPM